MLALPQRFAQAIIDHARREAPNECCGLLAGAGGRVLHLYAAANAEKSPLRYSLDPKELLGYLRDIDERGWELLGIYHSHTHTPAYPSATDLRLAFWPDSIYIIISLMGPEPAFRAFRLQEGKVEEEVLVIED